MQPNYANQQLKRCPSCQGSVWINETRCPGCGHMFRTQFGQVANPELNKTQAIIAPARSPWATSVFLAIVLTVIYPGIGQIYNGQFIKGIVFVAVHAIVITVLALPSDLRLVLGALVILTAMIDAFRICQKRAGGIHVTQSDWF